MAFHKCLYCKKPSSRGDEISGYRCAKHDNPSFVPIIIVNVMAFGAGLPYRISRWVHPSNLWTVNNRAGYYPTPMNDASSGAEYCAVRFVAAVDYSKRQGV